MRKLALTTVIALSVAGAAHAAPALPAPPASVVETKTDTSCHSVELDIYFQPGSTVLTAAARDALLASAGNWTDCLLAGIETEALARDASTEREAMNLARARTVSILNVLAAAGYPEAAEFARSDIRLPNTVNTSASLPSERRVTVTFRLGSTATS